MRGTEVISPEKRERERENWPTATRQELLALKSLMKKRCDFCHQSCAISLICPHLWNNGIMFIQKQTLSVEGKEEQS